MDLQSAGVKYVPRVRIVKSMRIDTGLSEWHADEHGHPKPASLTCCLLEADAHALCYLHLA